MGLTFSTMGVIGALVVVAVLWAWVWFLPILVIHVRRLPLGAAGMALPGIILLTPKSGDCGLRHELVHILQYRRYSPVGVALLLGWHYLLRPLWTFTRTGRRTPFIELWITNPLEKEACRRVGDPSLAALRVVKIGGRTRSPRRNRKNDSRSSAKLVGRPCRKERTR